MWSNNVNSSPRKEVLRISRVFLDFRNANLNAIFFWKKTHRACKVSDSSPRPLTQIKIRAGVCGSADGITVVTHPADFKIANEK